jgi:CTP:molybdopterin cytidylyltransferase MocA
MSVPLFILAAGASRRLGQPKQLVPFDGEPLLRRQCRIAIDADIGSVFVVLGCRATECSVVIADLPVGVMINDGWEEGMAASLRLAARQATDDSADALLILHGDQHGVTTDALRLLHAAWQANPTRPHLSRDGDHLGPPVIIPADHFSSMMNLTGDMGARRVLRHPVEVVIAGSAMDLNDPSQLPSM